MEKQVNWYEAMHGKSPYESMSQGIIEEKEDTMAGPKSTNWNTNYKIIEKQNDRLHTLRPPYYGGKDNTYEVFNVLESWNLDKDFYLGLERRILLNKKKILRKLWFIYKKELIRYD